MKRLISVSLVALLLLGMTGNVGFAQEEPLVSRISGSDRYATAVEVSKAGWEYSEVVVLARGDNYADALAGVPLAYLHGAPILLTGVDALPPVTVAEIGRLDASKIFILGGNSAVSEAVEAELVSLVPEVERIAGNDRFETAAEIARLVAPSGSSAAVVVNGMDFPDALSAAAYAATNGFPILLTQAAIVPIATSTVLDELKVSETIVVGGTTVVQDDVLAMLPWAVRVAGVDRFDTSVASAEHFRPESNTVFVATGMAYADAITGAALAARNGSGLLLTGSFLPQAVRDYLSTSNAEAVLVLGGENAVSKTVAEDMGKVLGLVGKRIEMTTASVLTSQPGGGQALRYPYKGYVTTVLDTAGDFVQIEFGRYQGWIPRVNVALTDKDIDSIRLGWQFTSPGNNSFLQQSPDLSGYNVYAPVMYYVSNNGLNMYPARNFSANIKLAREQGYQVWLTIAQFGTSPNLRDESIPWIINKALELDVDGINIDYEGMGSANRDAFSAFMGKLYTETRKHNLTLSVDVNRHSATVYGASYDRAALGQVSDYVILMAYDEHWSSSPQEGSVASHPWTRRSLELLLEEVPAEKVILGMPFYTRNWEIRDVTVLEEDSVVITGDAVRIRTEPTTVGGSETTIFLGHKDRVFRYVDEVEGENIEGVSVWYQVEFEEGQYGYITGRWSKYYPAGSYLGAKEVNSMSLGQKAAGQIVDNYDPDAKTSGWISSSTGNWIPMYDVSIDYDPESGQDVVTWTCQYNYLNKIWLENPMSLHKRAMLAEEFELAGLAAWSLDWMDAEAQLWNLLR